jgi:NTE family protein
VFAWQVGVLAGLADAGLDGRAARTILGTSGGSISAARLAVGIDARVDADQIARIAPRAAPDGLRRAVSQAMPMLMRVVWEGGAGDETDRRRRAGQFALRWRGVLSMPAHIQRQAARLPEADWPRSLRLVASDADTGERVVLDSSSGVRLADGVAAGRAVPGLVAPLNLGGRRLLDAALCSATNADLIPDDPELAIVITATPAAAEPGSLEARWNAALEAERSALATRWVRVVVVHASSAAVEAMGDDPLSTTDASAAVAAGREQGAEVGTEILLGARL